jgi:hypothetical protein
LSYEPIAKARFAVEPAANGEQIRIKARRQVFAMLFSLVWLAIWTAAGVAVISQLATNFQLLLAVWLCGWALGWIVVAGALAWMLTGSETLRIVGADLEVAQHALGWSRRWLYQGSRVRNLRVSNQPGWPYRHQIQIPFLTLGRSGSVKFDYGPRTIYVAPGLDDAEGQMIVDRLLMRLPPAAQ